MQSESLTRPVFQSSILRVEDYISSGAPRAHPPEEVVEEHEIVVLRRGTFVRYDAFGEVVADTNHLLFFHRDQPYQINYPLPGGERSTLFTLSGAVLLDILREYDPGAHDRPERPFTLGWGVVDPRLQLRRYALLSRSRYAPPIQLEEETLIWIGDALAQAYAAAGKDARRRDTQPTARFHRDLTNQVKLTIGARFGEKLTLEQIAAAVHTSPYFLCRVFKQQTGLPIHHYIQRVRLSNALEHIAECRETDFTRLALDLGFSSHSHFSTAFLNTFGLSPSQFRQTASGSGLRQMSKNLKV
jgi:AraC-like DNA-binding protein